MKVQVDLPPYVVKQPDQFELYRRHQRAKILVSLGCLRYIQSDLDRTIKHMHAVNEWQRGVFTNSID
jgi:hypothetical protein